MNMQSQRIAQIRSIALLAAVILAGVMLRMWQIDSRSVWHDEGLSIAFIRLPMERFHQALSYDVHPPLYYWALRGWMGLKFDIAWGRGLSAILSVVALWLTWLLARKVAGQKEALLAGAMMALLPQAVHFSQELRMYALQSALVAAMMLVGAKALENACGRWIGLTILAGVLACYTHYFSGVFVVGFLCVLPWARRDQDRSAAAPIIRTAIAALAACLLYLPWMRTGLSHVLMNSQGGLYESAQARLTLASIYMQAREAVLGLAPSFPFDGLLFSIERLGLARHWLSMLFVSGFLALGIFGGTRLRPRRLFVVGFVLFPLAMALLFQAIGGRFYARFYLPMMPAILVCVAAGIVALPRAWERWAVGVFFCAALASSSISVARYDLRDVSREVHAHLNANAPAESIILHSGAHSFWNMRAYDRNPDRHKILNSPQVPALIGMLYGPEAILTRDELSDMDDVYVVYAEWSVNPPQVRSSLEPLWFKEWQLVGPTALFSRFVKKMEIAHYRKRE